MNLTEIVCSLELSKKLKEIGIKQDSLFYWRNIETPYPEIVYKNYDIERSGDILISAFTANELLDFMPDKIDDGTLIYGIEGYIKIQKKIMNIKFM